MEKEEAHTTMQEECLEGTEAEPETVITVPELQSQHDNEEEYCDQLLECGTGDTQEGFKEYEYSSLDSQTYDSNDHCHILTLLPSKRSLRRRTCNSKSFSDKENLLHQQVEKSPDDVDDEEQVAFLDDNRPFREFPCTIQEKRDIRKSRKSKITTIIFLKSWETSHQKSWRRFCEEVQNIFSSMQLWKASLSDIEGKFGIGIQSYFIFLRLMFFLNLLACLLILGFILIPFIIVTRGIHQRNINDDITKHASVCYNYSRDKSSEPTYVHIQGIFSGIGYLESSYLFYGGYTLPLTTRSFWYNLPMAYMMTMLTYLLFCFIWVVRRAVLSLKQHRLDHGSYKILHCIKIFAAWDFCIRDLDTAKVKQQSISNDLKLDFEEEQRHINKANLPMKHKVLICTYRLILHLLIMALLTGSFYAIYRSNFISEQEQKALTSDGKDTIMVLIVAYLSPAVITVSNFILPNVFHRIVKYEGYSPSWENNLTLIRSVFLYLAGLGMFFFSMWQQITCGGNSKDENCVTCGYSKNHLCWETKVGQELYRLMVFDFISCVGGTFLLDLLRKQLTNRYKGKVAQFVGQPIFVIPFNVLNIVYGQTIMWSGMFYSPLLPFLNCIKFFLIFYIKKFSLYHTCTPSKRLFRISSCNVFFQLVLFLGLIVSSVPVIYSISRIHPSHACGPFHNRKHIWSDVMEEWLSSLPEVVQNWLRYLSSNVFAISLTLLLSLVLTFYISQNKANKQTIEQLKEHHKLQSHETLYLVRYYSSLVHQQKLQQTTGN